MSDHTQSADLEKAVHLVLSRMVGTQTGSRAFTRAAAENVSAINDARTAAQPGKWVMRHLGLSANDLDNGWAVARVNGNLLPRPLVEAFFPADEWCHFANFITLGPLGGWQKVEAVLSCWARGYNVDGTQRRKPLAANTIAFHIGAVHRLMNEICEVRKLAVGGQIELDPASLVGWEKQQLPKRVRPEELGSRPGSTDRRAPSLRAIRLALRALDREVETRKKTKQGRRHMARALRNRALLATFVTIGARIGAMGVLTRGDFDRFHKSHGHEGPALMLRPGKGLHADLVRAKFLPRELGEWIHEWIEYARINDKPEASLWVKNDGSRGALKESTIRKQIVRLLAPYVPDRDCSPHTLRHLCEKLAFLAGLDWLEENREQLIRGELSGLPSSPQTFADALLDHSLSAVQDTYKDINSERGRETWARIAAEGVWQLVYGDKGAPKGPDAEVVAAARERLAHADSELRLAKQMLAALEAKKRVVRQQAIDQAGLVAGGVTMKAMLELDGLADEIAAAVAAVGAAERRLDQAHQEMKEAKAILVPLPDEDPTPADVELLVDVVVVDVDGEGAVDEQPYRREKITPREFQWALGGPEVIADSTLRRYLAGKLPYRRGDRRNVWDPALRPGEPPACVERPSPRRAWILLDQLDWSRFPATVIDRLKYLQTLGEEEVFTNRPAA